MIFERFKYYDLVKTVYKLGMEKLQELIHHFLFYKIIFFLIGFGFHTPLDFNLAIKREVGSKIVVQGLFDPLRAFWIMIPNIASHYYNLTCRSEEHTSELQSQ